MRPFYMAGSAEPERHICAIAPGHTVGLRWGGQVLVRTGGVIEIGVFVTDFISSWASWTMAPLTAHARGYLASQTAIARFSTPFTWKIEPLIGR